MRGAITSLLASFQWRSTKFACIAIGVPDEDFQARAEPKEA
jgi:hypothetical protein